MMNAEQYIALEEKYGAHNYHPLDVVIKKAKGVWVVDCEGRKYLDCLSAYSALNHGHCHPVIRKAVEAQMKRVTLTSRAFRNDQLPLLYKALHDLTGYDIALPMNSGAEAVETAIKAARKWGYTKKGIPPRMAEIICCSGNFHGRTTTIVSFSTEEQYRDGFGPFTPGFRIVTYGDIEDLRRAITPNTAAFLVEPIQGEAGIVVPPEGYLREAARICRENNVLFIADEIQTGLGRTGKLFASEYEDVRPDAVIIGKALGGGFFPVSAVLADRELLGVFQPGDHGSTFGGNPVACAAACAVVEAIDGELLANVVARGDQLAAGLRDLPGVREVRGRGLLAGAVLDRPAAPVVDACRDRGLLVLTAGADVLRLLPPLVVAEAEVEEALAIIGAALA
jgi:ornithine--oxo-acid transaminase